jgi:antitoxin (DNA-binding transcriptional repressor) of toxin-antitoxin stability system
MRRTAVIALLVSALAGATACGGTATPSGAVPPETIAQQTTLAGADLVGSVGPGFEIRLTQDGKAVAALPAGTFTLAVSDRAATHDFALQAPDGTVTQLTDVPFTGTKRMTVKLTPGVWTYFCQPHARQMHGSFTVS